MRSNNEVIWTSLELQFDNVSCLTSREGITTFSCYLDNNVYTFPFYEEDIRKYNPQNVVTAIWEYIANYML